MSRVAASQSATGLRYASLLSTVCLARRTGRTASCAAQWQRTQAGGRLPMSLPVLLKRLSRSPRAGRVPRPLAGLSAWLSGRLQSSLAPALHRKRERRLMAALLAGLLLPPLAQAQEQEQADEFAPVEVGIRPDLPNVVISTDDGDVLIERIQDQDNVITGDFARTSRPCPPFCIQPHAVAPGVSTIGELELIDALQETATRVIDSRELQWYLDGTIPGATHIPYTEIAGRLDELGCTRDGENWNCDAARDVVLFCNGPWCGQSPTGIRAMLREGYPAERIAYYRGGMQTWQMLGLTVVPGDF